MSREHDEDLDSSPLFTNIRGNRLHTKQVRRVVRRALKDADLEDRSIPHYPGTAQWDESMRLNRFVWGSEDE